MQRTTEAIKAAIYAAAGEPMAPNRARLMFLLSLRNAIDQLLRAQFPEAANVLADAGAMARNSGALAR